VEDGRVYQFACERSELTSGAPLAFEVSGRALVLVDIGDEVVCMRNSCPHMGAPLSAGAVSGTCLPHGFRRYVTERDGEVLRCPWHAWEFDLRTGRTLHDERLGAKRFDTQIRDDEVWVTFQPSRSAGPSGSTVG
jgi:nitrite reductase (NADH) small subunit